MTTNLSDGTTTVTLPDDLVRTDEHSYSPVRQAVTQTLSGGIWVDVSVALAGEPITLVGGINGETYWGDVSRETYAQLRTFADVPGQEYMLIWRGQTYTVLFRHEDPPALDGTDLIDYNTSDPADRIIINLKFTRTA
jgi:hypothetical protein